MKICDICGNKFHSQGTLLNGKILNLCGKHKHHVVRYGKILSRTNRNKNEIRKKDSYWEMVLYDKKQKVNGIVLFDQLHKLEEIKKYKWCLTKKGKYGFYAKTDIRINGKRKTLYLHDLLVGEKRELQVDHKDGITLDCRTNNLRLVTQQQNLINKNHAKGYSWNKKLKKWETYVGINNKRIRLGYFKNEIDAINARREAEIKYYKEFAPIIKYKRD